MKGFTSILSSPRNWRPAGFGDLLLLKKENNRFPTTTLGNDTPSRSVRTVKIGPTSAGFTLIELLVVVLIIGILAAMALPNYQRAVEISRVGAAISYSRAFRDSMDRYFMAHGKFASRPEQLDIRLTECPKYFRCNYSYMVTDGKFELWRQNGPFNYAVTTRSNVSPGYQGAMYCAAERSNTKGVEFCQHWGEDYTPNDGQWFRALIQ